MLISENFALLRELIPEDKGIVIAVTKTQPPGVIRAAYAAGLRVMGENRVQEALEKAAQLLDLPLEWHLIGHLQTNKVKQAVCLFSLIHSVDSFRLATEIDRAAAKAGKIQNVLIQINVAGEVTKSGVSPGDAASLAAFVDSLPNLKLCGVMTIAPVFADPEQTRPIFRAAHSIFCDMRSKALYPDEFKWLSMGMTQDYKVAVEEGANMVRIGTGLFGSRTTV